MPSRRDGRACLVAFAGYAVFFTAFFWQSLTTGELIAPSDALDFGVAGYQAAPSLWTQGLYSGYPIAADPQSLIFYPLLELFRVLGIGWNLFMVAPFIVAATGTFLLVRRVTGSTVAGVFGGLVFGFSGPMLGNLGHFNQLHAVAWAPFALYGLQRIRDTEHRRGAAVTAVAMAMMWLAGHPQLPVYLCYLALALLIGGLLVDKPSTSLAATRVVWSGVAVALGLGLAAVLLLPMVELSTFSGRAESNWELYTAKAVPPWQMLTVVVPYAFGFWADNDLGVPYFGDGTAGENLAYVGVLPLALALASPFVLRARKAEARLWMMLALVAGILAVCAATPLGTLFYYAPGYARFRMPSRHLFLMALCVAVASGLALDDLIRRRRTGALMVALAAVAVAGLGGFAIFAATTPAVSALLGNQRYAGWTLGAPLVAVVASALTALLVARFAGERSRPLVLGSALTVLLAVDLGAVHYRVPGAHLEYADVLPEETQPRPEVEALRAELRRTGERVLAVDGTHNPFLLPNLTRPWDVPAAGGSGPLGIARYVELLRMGSPGDVPIEVLQHPHLALDLFSIRYALVPDSSSMGAELRAQPERWSTVTTWQYDTDDPDSRYTLFRNASARPRAWCATRLVRADDGDARDAIRTGTLKGGAPFEAATTVLADRDALTEWTDVSTSAPTRITPQPSTLPSYRVESATPCVLVLSEVFYPWWRATLDGRTVVPARVNHTMVGVAVPAGTHDIRLSLRPVSLWTGAALSGVSVMGWLFLVVAAIRRP